MNFYPGYTKEQITNLTYSEMATLVKMILYIKDPRKMDSLKTPQRNFTSEEEWEQAILAGRKK